MGRVLGQTPFALPTCRNLIVGAGAEPAAWAQIDIHEGLGIFQCDGTVSRFRGEGLQTELMSARLLMTAVAGYDPVTTGISPGSQLQALGLTRGLYESNAN